MNITVTKIKRELKKNHGWDNLDNEEQKWFVDGLIKDTLAIVDEQLRKHECDTVLSEKLLDGAGKFRPKSLHIIENNNGWIDGIPNPENKPTVNHINSIRSDDRKVNLEWNTYSENNKHAFDFGFQKPMRGDKCWIYNINPDLHPTSKEVIDLSNGKTYGSLKSACLDLKIKYSSMLSKISLNGKGKNDTSLMYLSELEELPNNIIIKIGNKEFNFNSEYQSKWIKIESEKDLPKEKGLKCLFLCIHGNTTYISDDVLEDPKWFVNKYSHWRLKDEIKDPIY